MSRADKLKDYRSKRDFKKSPEPSAGRRTSPKTVKPRFVIQKHDATTLHYDFRLEVDGVLKSWAIPKGPSLDPRDKRMAVPTEDHPLDYIDFEGVIPEGNYGAGPVIVWDIGTYENRTEKNGRKIPMADAIEQGHVSFWLEGKKLRGGFALTRTGGGDRPRWLLVKKKDEGADARRRPVNSQPESVLSGRRIEELGAAT